MPYHEEGETPSEPDSHPLDAAIWRALTSVQKGLAEGDAHSGAQCCSRGHPQGGGAENQLADPAGGACVAVRARDGASRERLLKSGGIGADAGRASVVFLAAEVADEGKEGGGEEETKAGDA